MSLCPSSLNDFILMVCAFYLKDKNNLIAA